MPRHSGAFDSLPTTRAAESPGSGRARGGSRHDRKIVQRMTSRRGIATGFAFRQWQRAVPFYEEISHKSHKKHIRVLPIPMCFLCLLWLIFFVEDSYQFDVVRVGKLINEGELLQHTKLRSLSRERCRIARDIDDALGF